MGAAPSSASAAGAIRTALSARCRDDSPPGSWRVAAKSAGVSGADAFLCHLSRSIIGALEHLAASAEIAQARVSAARDAGDAEARSHSDELEWCVESTETSKRVALERQLCAVDAALERLRAERGAVSEAVDSLTNAELVARHVELAARLDAADAQLLALPTSVVEPPYVGVVIDETALQAGAAVFGRVVAPRAVTAADLTLDGAPSAEELKVSLGAAAAATHVEISLEPEADGAAPQPLRANFSSDIPRRSVNISIVVPVDAPVGSSVCFGPLTVSGQPVSGLPPLGPLVVKLAAPADLSPEHAAQLQAWLPPGGSPHPSEWKEVYRATTHGFGAKAFHARCDRRARLLVLVRAREGGWLFGGFTAVGFSPPPRGFGYITDPSAFLFSLSNLLGHPEKLESKRTGEDLAYDPNSSVAFSLDLYICDNSDTKADSWSWTGRVFASSASIGAHPMARGEQYGWLIAEVVAWVV